MRDKVEKGYARIKEAGILVTLPGDLPLDRATVVADSLLAAPIQAVEVVYRAGTSLKLVADLKQRSGDLMVIGLANVEMAAHIGQAAAAGAEFISSPRLDVTLQQACAEHGLGYIPTIISVWAAQSALERACPMVRLRTGGPQGGAYLQAVREVVPDLDFLLDVIDLQLSDVNEYAALGAVALVTGSAIYEGSAQPMADIISRARAMQQAWRAARKNGPNKPPKGSEANGELPDAFT
jgi:2-dehydro-3-deoxyphosphogluconate aldolase/(4S)-4-hydroxy-2-oxoglutarate aldolase